MGKVNIIFTTSQVSTFIADKSIKLESSLLTEQGLPIVRLSNGRAFTFKVDLGCWWVLSLYNTSVLPSYQPTVANYSQTSLIHASLMCSLPHNPNTPPGNLSYHFLFTMN